MSALIVTVRGIPAPQGSKRFVGRSGGKGRMVESSKAVGPWREAVRAETQRVIEGGGPTFPTGPLTVTLRLALARPKGHYGTGRNAALLKPSAPDFPAGRPDLDKLARAVLDGLTAGGAFGDDAQIAELVARKTYADAAVPTGVRIEIRILAPFIQMKEMPE